MENTRQSLELAQVLANHGEEFFSNNHLCAEQIKAFNAIITCRTSILGGHASRCDVCGYTQQAYNSCRNRHCPKCQFIKQAQWIDRLKATLPPIKYFHLVFTIPQCLHKTLYINQQTGYSLMFKAAWTALKDCLEKPAYYP
jgi:predicted Zn-ribbon and HTH transcriptional regulator